MKEILIGLVATPLMLLFWVAVQHAWRRAFDMNTNDDMPTGCGACGTGACETGGCRRENNERRCKP